MKMSIEEENYFEENLVEDKEPEEKREPRLSRYTRQDGLTTKLPLEKRAIHHLRMEFDERQDCWVERWKRVRCGKKKANAIRDMSISVSEVCDRFSLSPFEVENIRSELNREEAKYEEQKQMESKLSDYVQDIYEAYEEKPYLNRRPNQIRNKF